MLPDALFLGGLEEALDEAVLLGRIGRDELLSKPIVPAGSSETMGVEVGVGVAVGARPAVGVGVGVPEVVARNKYAPISHRWPVVYWSPVKTLFGHDDPGIRAVL